MQDNLLSIRVTDIGEYIRHQSCERRFKLNLDDMALARSLPFFDRLFNPLDLVLQQSGRQKENEWEEELKKACFVNLTPPKSTKNKSSSLECRQDATEWVDFVNGLSNLDAKQPAYGRNICVNADLGAFHIKGEMDFLLVLWDQNGAPRFRIVECKASRRDRTYHRIQVALYHRILHDLLKNSPVTVCGKTLKSEDVDCVVVRIDENTNNIQSILGLQALDKGDLAQLEEDITHLLAKDGRLKRIASHDVKTLGYQLNEKCGTCIFDVYCLPESGIRHSLELIGTEPAIVRELRVAGVSDIDQLSELDLESAQARDIRSRPGFSKSLEVLKVKALTRKSTLPSASTNGPHYKVRYLPFSGQGQLPEHVIDGHRLVRIYLSVDYDYVENRVGALAAHVTTSTGNIHTPFVESAEGWRPDPRVKEVWQTNESDVGHARNDIRDLNNKHSKQIVHYKTSQWTGLYDKDTESERKIIEDFLRTLIDAVIEVAEAEKAPIHFYVWSKSEMTHLVEACYRASTTLLSHLNELLGCREGLDQLIFSCLGEEVDNRYALGWTGRGLVVATSLPWFGQRFHWFRQVGSSGVDLERVFTQDLFDFKTTLAIKECPVEPTITPYARYEWEEHVQNADINKHLFEIRSRFYDSLPAPYWHAVWRILPKPEEEKDKRVANAITRYTQASKPHHLDSYLEARTQALRWIEERLSFKNREISKPILALDEIKQFTLGVNTVCQAAVDFLRLETTVEARDWTAKHLVPPTYRVSSGDSIPLRNVHSKWNGDRKKHELLAKINLADFNIEPDAFASNCSFGQGDFVRITPCSEDPNKSQTLGQLRYEGSTCVVRAIDWTSLTIVLDVIPMSADTYRLHSASHNVDGPVFDYATIDESPSDFVAPRVENVLLNNGRSPINQWLDPLKPAIPPEDKLEAKVRIRYNRLLKSKLLPQGKKLNFDQKKACLEGLDARIQLLHGPPGTGKTVTTAAAILVRILARLKVGDVVLLAASTHTAVDILLKDLDRLQEDSFVNCAILNGHSMPPIKLAKTISSPDNPRPGGNISIIESKPYESVNKMLSDSVAVIGGTVPAILKLWNTKGKRLANLRAKLLVIDEASMMVFPNFLALATLLDPGNGQILLAGDHQQLPPIVSHDWINEDRPPVVLYQPFTSAYVAIQNIGRKQLNPTQVCQSTLRYSFRLPAEIRELVNRLYGQESALDGRPGAPYYPKPVLSSNIWANVWNHETGLYLITHNERRSKLSNRVEVHIIEQILERCRACLPKSIAIITPHRAQRGLLNMRLKQYTEQSGMISSINTVESFQGGEQDTIIVSASESDPAAISSSTKFILDLKRSNVAFSRAKKRLIVICSEALLDFIPPEAADYEATLLWRSLRRLCSRKIGIENIELDGNTYRAKMFTYSPAIY